MTSAVNIARPELLPWDSEFFGFPIAKVEVESFAADFLEEMKTWCARNRIACLYVLGPANDALEPVDLRVTYEWNVSASALSSLSIRLAEAEDIPVLEKIARINHRDSRFYADGRFDRVRCDELYVTWIRRSCEGWADAVWVAPHDDAPAGYITCHRNRGSIGLVAVADHARGKGLGRALVESAKNYFRDAGLARIEVVTQGRNTAARALYETCGFELATVRYWYHLWFPEHLHA